MSRRTRRSATRRVALARQRQHALVERGGRVRAAPRRRSSVGCRRDVSAASVNCETISKPPPTSCTLEVHLAGVVGEDAQLRAAWRRAGRRAPRRRSARRRRTPAARGRSRRRRRRRPRRCACGDALAPGAITADRPRRRNCASTSERQQLDRRAQARAPRSSAPARPIARSAAARPSVQLAGMCMCRSTKRRWPARRVTTWSKRIVRWRKPSSVRSISARTSASSALVHQPVDRTPDQQHAFAHDVQRDGDARSPGRATASR